MNFGGNKLSNLCNWVSWRRIIEFSFVFLFVRFMFSLCAAHPYWTPSDTVQYICIYLFGICCGIGLVFSADRRKHDCKTRLHALIKLIKDHS
jgi:hypothetical protein